MVRPAADAEDDRASGHGRGRGRAAHFRDTNELLACVRFRGSLAGTVAVLYDTGTHAGYTARKLSRFPAHRKALVEALDAAVALNPKACPWDPSRRDSARRALLAGCRFR